MGECRRALYRSHNVVTKGRGCAVCSVGVEGIGVPHSLAANLVSMVRECTVSSMGVGCICAHNVTADVIRGVLCAVWGWRV